MFCIEHRNGTLHQMKYNTIKGDVKLLNHSYNLVNFDLTR